MSDGVAEANRVIVFDTTLRDGEQSPGASMTSVQKLRLARQLARLGVDVIEAGFPAASHDDERAVREIAQRVGDNGETAPVICGLARATGSDITAAWRAVRGARRPRIHTFLATSDLHMLHKLRMSRTEVLHRIDDAVRRARDLCDDVEFSPEDASRSDRAFLCDAVGAAIAAGATTINVPDTVGCSMPHEFGELIGYLVENVDGISGVVLSVHCHNDLGLATANTLAAVRNGARQVEVTVNGIGERAGNAALEEIAVLLRVHSECLGVDTGVDAREIARTSRMVSEATGLAVQANKAIVGSNAFAHESGIHQDGILKHQETYEFIRPETVGADASRLVLGKHSGRHALRARLADLGYELDDATLDRAFRRFKDLADKKRVVTEADLAALVADLLEARETGYRLLDLQVVCGRPGMPTATVRLLDPVGVEHVESAVGAGPVDATYRAIDAIVETHSELLEFDIHGITEGIDAQGRVAVQIEDGHGGAVSGYGADTDIIVASARAYLSALNRLHDGVEAVRARSGNGEET
jgi:2-isopropylmalate synthase